MHGVLFRGNAPLSSEYRKVPPRKQRHQVSQYLWFPCFNMVLSAEDAAQRINEALDCDPGHFKGRLDPVLKLYRGCQLILTINLAVGQGKKRTGPHMYSSERASNAQREFSMLTSMASVFQLSLQGRTRVVLGGARQRRKHDQAQQPCPKNSPVHPRSVCLHH
uniref:Uncharacterized protein n=1 Tax=Grammatophora oceanica TaxID=210454 RepID=A0A6U5J3F4_9STRA|mmetsp:Transcript_23714/g.35128  ORF Transcript_23714/g.35128 Transcript_23714/m.35128 type:complete len:163 (+) Transcript_23714:356-844(+)